MLADNKPAMLPSAPQELRSIELPKLLALEGFQEEVNGGRETVSEEDDSDQLEDAVYVEPKLDGSAISRKRKALKKLKSRRFVSIPQTLSLLLLFMQASIWICKSLSIIKEIFSSSEGVLVWGRNFHGLEYHENFSPTFTPVPNTP